MVARTTAMWRAKCQNCERVAWVGDEALYQANGLAFRKGNTIISMVVGLPQTRERAVKIAKLILDRVAK